MKLQKHKGKIISIGFFIIVIIFLSYATYNYFDYQNKVSTFRTYEMSGHIQELKLVTTFPDEGLYIGFDNGEYRFVNINYYWTYAQLILIHPWNNVTITYERNYFGDTKVLHILEVPYE